MNQYDTCQLVQKWFLVCWVSPEKCVHLTRHGYCQGSQALEVTLSIKILLHHLGSVVNNEQLLILYEQDGGSP